MIEYIHRLRKRLSCKRIELVHQSWSIKNLRMIHLPLLFKETSMIRTGELVLICRF